MAPPSATAMVMFSALQTTNGERTSATDQFLQLVKTNPAAAATQVLGFDVPQLLSYTYTNTSSPGPPLADMSYGDYQAPKIRILLPTQPDDTSTDDTNTDDTNVTSPESDEELYEDDSVEPTSLTLALGAVPPPLPPSVEEAYRRKCIQLKTRMNEIDEANDASRLRLARMQRQVEKMRLERAFLLEQLAKRTSTNVEDSEGSPSPPPTPKEKPLRTKRGHRKPSFLTNLSDGRAGSAFIQQGPVTLSPSSDAFSHTHPENALSAPTTSKGIRAPSNGHIATGAGKPQGRAKSAFEAYGEEMRPILAVKHRKAIAEGTFDLDRHLAISWKELPDAERMRHQKRFEDQKKATEVDKEAVIAEQQSSFAEGQKGLDEDVEMGEDTEAEAVAETASAGGGFTAVNKQ